MCFSSETEGRQPICSWAERSVLSTFLFFPKVVSRIHSVSFLSHLFYLLELCCFSTPKGNWNCTLFFWLTEGLLWLSFSRSVSLSFKKFSQWNTSAYCAAYWTLSTGLISHGLFPSFGMLWIVSYLSSICYQVLGNWYLRAAYWIQKSSGYFSLTVSDLSFSFI